MKEKKSAAKKQYPTRKGTQNMPKAAPKISSSQPKAAPLKTAQRSKENNLAGALKKQPQRPAPPKKTAQNRPVTQNRVSPNTNKRPIPPKNANKTAPKGQTAAKSPQKPVSEQSRRAADNAVRTKAAASVKKRPYRGGNYSLYFIFAAIVIVIVFIILANTVLFKCSTIEVSGTARYTAEEIIEYSGLKTGENLLHINTKSAEQSIISSFAFVDKAEVKKSFPTKIVIEITEAENRFVLDEGGEKYVISKGDRVLGQIPSDGLAVVKGYEAESTETGCYLTSKVEAKNGMPDKIFETAELVGLTDITEIDLTDRFSVKITVENRIVLNIGPVTQLESKLRVADALIRKKIGEEETVTVLLTNPEKVAIETINPAPKPVLPTAEDKQENTDTPESTSAQSSQNT